MQAIGPLVSALGIAQIVSWGSLFYAVGVVGRSMKQALGVSELFVFGAFTAGLLTSGALSPYAGRLIDRRGGRLVLSIGSVLSALAMILLAAAFHPAVLVFGWIVAGAAMATCLYDPAFAALSQHTGDRYRKAVTALTIFGGFASTVFWPLTHVLTAAWGWRWTLVIYAGLHLFLCLPIHLLFVPRRLHIMSAVDNEPVRDVPANGARRGLGLLTASFAAASFVSAVVAVHVVSLLMAKGLTQAQAISIAMLFGPMQVAGRIGELLFASRLGEVHLGVVAFVLLFAAITILIVVEGPGVASIFFVVAYGFGNGLFTIVRGTVPAYLYGREGLGSILGHLARVGLYSRALAPASFSGMLAVGLTRGSALATLAVVMLGGLASYLEATRSPNRPPGRAPPRTG